MSPDPAPAPRVAVVVPVHRHPALLPEAIESVLAQDAPFAIRLVLVNDGCPFPETEAVCLDYARSQPHSIRYLHKPNGGLSDARNHGIDDVLARDPDVEAIFFLDADNRLRPKALARAMAALDADPETGWIYPNLDMFGLTRRLDYGGPYSRLIHSAQNICEAGSLVRRAVFEAGVRFDTGLRQGFEDWDFFLTAGEAGFRGANLEDFGFLYRKRPESMLSEAERDRSAILAALQQRHPATASPRALAMLEQAEAPRNALWLADADQPRVRLTSDPLLEGETLSLEDTAQRYWLARSNPSRHPFPAHLTFATPQVIETLRHAGLLHFAFWQLERWSHITALPLCVSNHRRSNA
jgi:Glycosyltransferases involved in cell wall biogenesis